MKMVVVMFVMRGLTSRVMQLCRHCELLSDDVVRDLTCWKKLILLKLESIMSTIDLLYCTQLQNILLCHKQVFIIV